MKYEYKEVCSNDPMVIVSWAAMNAQVGNKIWYSWRTIKNVYVNG